MKSITYSNGSPTPNYNGMRVVFDISNKSSNTLVIQGSVDSQKGKDLTVITIGDQQFLPTGWQQDPNKAINPDDKDREYTIPGGFLTAIWEYSVIFDTLSPPNFKKPIKCKIRGTLGNEKIEFVFDLPSPPK